MKSPHLKKYKLGLLAILVAGSTSIAHASSRYANLISYDCDLEGTEALTAQAVFNTFNSKSWISAGLLARAECIQTAKDNASFLQTYYLNPILGLLGPDRGNDATLSLDEWKFAKNHLLDINKIIKPQFAESEWLKRQLAPELTETFKQAMIAINNGNVGALRTQVLHANQALTQTTNELK